MEITEIYVSCTASYILKSLKDFVTSDGHESYIKLAFIIRVMLAILFSYSFLLDISHLQENIDFLNFKIKDSLLNLFYIHFNSHLLKTFCNLNILE